MFKAANAEKAASKASKKRKASEVGAVDAGSVPPGPGDLDDLPAGFFPDDEDADT